MVSGLSIYVEFAAPILMIDMVTFALLAAT
jgi:hypothetical protein